MVRTVWLMVACGVLIVLVSGGLRQSFGIFLAPVADGLAIGRETYGLVIALQALIYGLAQPFVGLLADRFGARVIIAIGAGVYALGLFGSALSESSLHLTLSLGLLVGLGLSGATQVVVLGAVGKVVPNKNRGMVFGTIIASTSLGMFFLVPLLQLLLSEIGWRQTFFVMAALLACIPFLGLGLRGSRTQSDAPSGPTITIRAAINEARHHQGYVLLTAGFFVCGFHVTFVGTHFPAFLTDNGVHPNIAAYGLGLIGLCNVAGAYLFGLLGDRFSKKNLLTGIYAGRAVVMALILVVPINNVTALLFGAALGFLWLATVPLTSGIVAQVFGTQYFSMLFGVVFMSHQLGSFAGAWLGGLIHDQTGNYDMMWMACIGFGVLAALLHWPIEEQPLCPEPAP